MSVRDLSSQEIDLLVGTRDASTGIEFPPMGLQPYHSWLIRTLQLLSESSFGAFRVFADDSSPTTIGIMPGSATISNVPFTKTAGTLNLAAHNNQTVFIWLSLISSVPTISAGEYSLGWPTTAHVKLAQVTLNAGAITSIIDLRYQSVFNV